MFQQMLQVFVYSTSHLTAMENLHVDWNLLCSFNSETVIFLSFFSPLLLTCFPVSTQEAILDKQINTWDSSSSLFCAALPAFHSQLDLLGEAERLVVSWAPFHKLQPSMHEHDSYSCSNPEACQFLTLCMFIPTCFIILHWNFLSQIVCYCIVRTL